MHRRILTIPRTFKNNQYKNFFSCNRFYSSINEDNDNNITLDLPKAHPPIRYYYDNKDIVGDNIKLRKANGNINEFTRLYEKRQSIQKKTEEIRQQRNTLKKKLSKKHKNNGEEIDDSLKNEGKQIKEQLKEIEIEERAINIELLSEALELPNFTHPDSPIGDESNAKLVKDSGKINEKHENWKDHFSFLIDNDLADFERGSQVTGNKFCFLKGEIALLEIALKNWVIGKVISYSPDDNSSKYIPISTPELAHTQYISGCGFSPRGEHSQIYNIENHPISLIATSEIPLAGLYSNELVFHKKLPIRLVGYSNCFRAEVGGGIQSKGLYRLHQFSKVELFILSTQDNSENLLNELLNIQQSIITDLGIPYRVLDMPTEELGASAYRKYDIEAWMPSRNGYGEICSASNCTDYQSRRLNLRYQIKKGDNHYMHTLNATALAVPRIIMAIIENFQQKDGSVEIPKVLHPYMHGITHIHPKKK